MAPSVGNLSQVPQNPNIYAIHTTEQQVQMDIPGPSEQQPSVPPTIPTPTQFLQEDIHEEVQRRIRLAREHEIQR
ncbi:hypothetical protein LIER_27952 [Lithospermum erythrorhizon]|uniref:Uncharacterized protein n=1 Tax=Lithospermum erythrorhizon TaxID=34254 RepID=A0AAV3RHY5_LITER